MNKRIKKKIKNNAGEQNCKRQKDFVRGLLGENFNVKLKTCFGVLNKTLSQKLCMKRKLLILLGLFLLLSIAFCNKLLIKKKK